MLKLVKRHGSAVWYIRGTVAGRRIDESTRLADRALAEAYRAKREWEIQHAKVHGDRGIATFAQACVLYLQHARDPRFIARLLDHFGETQLRLIDQAAADRAAIRLYPNAAPSTLNRQLYTPLSAILQRAAASGLCDPPVFRRPKNPPGKTRWLRPEEAERLIMACEGRLRHMRPLILFMLYSGARASEALELDWRDVSLERAHVTFTDTKNGESRGVPLHPRVVAELSNLRHRAGRVFLNRLRQPYAVTPDGGSPIASAFQSAARKAGVQPLTPHDLRHTWATWFYRANRDLTALQKLGGWKSVQMVMRYTHADSGEFAAGIGRLPGAEIGGELGKADTAIAGKRSKIRAV